MQLSRTVPVTAAVAVSAMLVQPAAAQTMSERFGFQTPTLEAYVEASERVLAIYENHAQPFKNARGDREAMRALRAKVNARMREVIRDVDGINVRQFKRVSMTARTSPELYDHLETRMEKARKRNDGSH